ncbi:MAG: hypothetical protein QM296_04730 [Bacillota bacterium]|nr:hypothetical protein [Bacillota bacterium]
MIDACAPERAPVRVPGPRTRLRAPADGLRPRPGGYCRSLAGGDRGRLYLIRRVYPEGHGTGRYLDLVDGSRHGWLRPKRKNLRHVLVLAGGSDPEFWDWCQTQQDIRQIDGRVRRLLEKEEKEFMMKEEQGS